MIPGKLQIQIEPTSIFSSQASNLEDFDAMHREKIDDVDTKQKKLVNPDIANLQQNTKKKSLFFTQKNIKQNKV